MMATSCFLLMHLHTRLLKQILIYLFFSPIRTLACAHFPAVAVVSYTTNLEDHCLPFSHAYPLRGNHAALIIGNSTDQGLITLILREKAWAKTTDDVC